MYIPVLPSRFHGKLMFVLCRTCAQNRQQTRCSHGEAERVLNGCWTTPELSRALELGYRLVQKYEAWHFPRSTQYNRETGEEGLFAPYVNTFLKLKQQAAGFPSNVRTEAEKSAYIQDYEEREDIRLDRDRIEKNPGQYYVAKSCLNLLWGKLSQRPNNTQVILVFFSYYFIFIFFLKHYFPYLYI